MATESCPRCGEKAISQTGHCVFCGAVVISAATKPAGKEYEKAMRIYRFASASFLVVGILYLAFAVIGSVMNKAPMVSLFLTGGLTAAHGILLIMNNDWMRSVTKVFCSCRLGLFVFVFLVLAPYMLHLGPFGIGYAAIFAFDMVCLVLMIRTIDDVYFA